MNNFKVNKKILELAKKAETSLKKSFEYVEKIQKNNENKVLKAFLSCKVSSSHFLESTGYGYDDTGREKLDQLFAKIFKAQDAFVRFSFVSGTHTIATALFAVLQKNDTMLLVTGTPYPTIRRTIGIEKNKNSLLSLGVKYEEIDIFKQKELNLNLLKKNIKKNVKLIYIQRSKGYCAKNSVTIDEIEKIAKLAHKINPKIVVFVDNCYGEFVETKEPTEVGADLIAGSLIKNPGGAVAKSGGYIAGKKNLISLCAEKFTAPGLGKEIGCSLNQNKDLFFGIFVAPLFVGNALKVSLFLRKIFEIIGFEVIPKPFEKTSDIVSVIKLNSKKALLSFCEGIQNNSPVNSFFTPTASKMPGYEKKVIMACGGFISGASLEISADAELKPPYNVFFQGGICYNSSKTAILNTLEKMLNEKIIKL